MPSMLGHSEGANRLLLPWWAEQLTQPRSLTHHPSTDDPLVSPCRCAGTQRYIHTNWLDSWMKVKVERGDDGVDKHPMCELCGEEFTLGTLDIRRDAGVSACIKYKLVQTGTNWPVDQLTMVTFRNRITNSRIGRGLRWFDNMWLYSTVFAGVGRLRSCRRCQSSS